MNIEGKGAMRGDNETLDDLVDKHKLPKRNLQTGMSS